MNSSKRGTRSDLARFLRSNRRALLLSYVETWGDEDFPVHTFISKLKVPPFVTTIQDSEYRVTAQLKSRILDWQVFPF
jgi:hypothetical protein